MSLDTSHIIRVELKIGYIALVEGGHQSRINGGVTQSQTMAELMGRYLEEVDTYIEGTEKLQRNRHIYQFLLNNKESTRSPCFNVLINIQYRKT